jgi:hypothetical protein
MNEINNDNQAFEPFDEAIKRSDATLNSRVVHRYYKIHLK